MGSSTSSSPMGSNRRSRSGGNKHSKGKKGASKGKKCLSVDVPDKFDPVFRGAEIFIEKFFAKLCWNPTKADISIGEDRFVLIRGTSLTVELFKLILMNSENEYKGEEYYRNLLYDLSFNMGKCDCKKTLEKFDPNVGEMMRVSCGPAYFSFTGFSRVKLFPYCVPSTNPAKFCFVFEHPFSFEAHAFNQEGFITNMPICIMSCGYSSGWSSHSFGIPLVTFELTCISRGDPSCLFVMAHRDYIFKKIKELKKTRFSSNLRKRIYVPNQLPGILKEELSKRSRNRRKISRYEYERVKKENIELMKKIKKLEEMGK